MSKKKIPETSKAAYPTNEGLPEPLFDDFDENGFIKPIVITKEGLKQHLIK